MFHSDLKQIMPREGQKLECRLQSSGKLSTISGVINSRKRLVWILLISLNLCWFQACKEYDNTNLKVNLNTSDANQAINTEKTKIPSKDDTAELGRIIELPFTPEDAVWREETSGDQTGDNRTQPPGERKLVAILKFTSEDAKKIVEQAERHQPPSGTKLNVESWFPPELIAKSQSSADKTIEGATYAANDFFRSPYLKGKITRISDTNFFVLELSGT